MNLSTPDALQFNGYSAGMLLPMLMIAGASIFDSVYHTL